MVKTRSALAASIVALAFTGAACSPNDNRYDPVVTTPPPSFVPAADTTTTTEGTGLEYRAGQWWMDGEVLSAPGVCPQEDSCDLVWVGGDVPVVHPTIP